MLIGLAGLSGGLSYTPPLPATSGGPPRKETEFEGKAPEQVHYKKDVVFIMMAFKGKGMEEVYSAIAAGCKGLGLHPMRADQTIGSGNIMKDVLTLIHDAEFIVCDLTNARPNVYYELGYAHGVGNNHLNILLTAKQGTTLHFDIAQLRVLHYRSTEELRTIVTTTLTAMMRHTRKTDMTAPDDQPERPPSPPLYDFPINTVH
jgi:hypothetical protein